MKNCQAFELSNKPITVTWDFLEPKLIIQQLKKMGYTVMTGSDETHGLPNCILLGREDGLVGFKDDFSRLMEPLGVEFKAGEYYKIA